MGHVIDTPKHDLDNFSKRVQEEIKKLQDMGLEPVFYDGPEVQKAHKQISAWLTKTNHCNIHSSKELSDAVKRYMLAINSHDIESLDLEKEEFNPNLWVQAAEALNKE